MVRTHKRLVSFLLCLCLLAACMADGLLYALAETTGTVFGIDPGSYLSVRDGPSVSNKLLDRLYNDNVVTILDTVVGSDRTWYKITYQKDGKTVTGFSSAEFIRINVSYETDEEFEAYLTAQGFPEDYKVKLRDVHARHPKWVFQAQHLSMTWAKALSEEQKALKNAIVDPESWRSMEYGAYNWTSNSYVAVDSGGWVTAAPAVVAYYMDPRNFLDETYIFQFENLQYSDQHTVEGVKAILPSRYDGYAEDLLKAAKETRVSAYFLATRMRQEDSKIDGTWVDTEGGVSYVGYYNFFNYGAYAGSQYGTYHGAVTNGAIYAQRQGWDTPYKCLRGSAEKIGSSYINKGQNTLYYQKFNVAGDNLYNHQYMTNVQAPYSEAAIRAKSATTEEKNSALTFIIPVYKEMQTAPTILPGKTGNNNNFLNALSVEGYSLTPAFDRYTQHYSLHVGQASSIKVNAQKSEQKATLAGDGTITLHKGDNTVAVTVTATSGETRTYTLTVTTEGGQPEDNNNNNPDTPPSPKEPSITGLKYAVGDAITKVEPGTSLTDFIGHLAVADGTAAVYTADGQAKTEGLIATGDILRLYSGNVLHKSYPVLIYGDVNGDGKVNSQDLRRAQRHILGAAALNGYTLTAADVNKDGKINSQDLRRAQLYILGALNSLQVSVTTNP